MNNFRENIGQWLQLDANIQQYNNKIKELKTKKSNVEEKILKEIETKTLKILNLK